VSKIGLAIVLPKPTAFLHVRLLWPEERDRIQLSAALTSTCCMAFANSPLPFFYPVLLRFVAQKLCFQTTENHDLGAGKALNEQLPIYRRGNLKLIVCTFCLGSCKPLDTCLPEPPLDPSTAP
jgi:hypothetical protein